MSSRLKFIYLQVKRKKIFEDEMRALAGNAEDQMREVQGTNAVFLTATHAEHARPMFSVAWQGLLAALTRPLHESNDPFVISLCLEGLRSSIHVACLFDMPEAATFIQSMSKFTHLASNHSEIKPKHVEAIKTLLGVGIAEGNYLGDSWKEVLQCVSQLELASVLGQQQGNMGRAHQNGAERIAMNEMASQSIGVSVDKIFSKQVLSSPRIHQTSHTNSYLYRLPESNVIF